MESSDKRTQGGGRVARGGVRQPRGRAKKTEDVGEYSPARGQSSNTLN